VGEIFYSSHFNPALLLCRNSPELLHHAKHIGSKPKLDHFAPAYTGDADTLDFELFPGGGDALKIALMGAS
jgi:hypothetical protein